jgi:UDP-N-acetylmuramate--alanine ligase
LTRRVITYGLDDRDALEAELVGGGLRLEAFGSSCTVEQRLVDGQRIELGAIRIQVPGRHNMLNALAAIAVGLEVGVPFARLAAALAEFAGAERRFQKRGEVNGILVVDDYGHHPTEIAAVIAAARAGINRRVVVVFQPHRYSRTSQLLGNFGNALAGADEIVLTDIYSAGEAPLPGVTIETLTDAVRVAVTCPVHLVKALDTVPAAVASLARRGDLVLTLGAGSIGGVGDRILDAIRAATVGTGGRP